MIKTITGVVATAAIALSVVAAPAAQAAPTIVQPNIHAGQRWYNSSASDRVFAVRRDLGYADLIFDPGTYIQLDSYDMEPGKNTRIVVYGQSFRVRYNKSSGSYQGCQNIPAGSKEFTPANYDRIDFLMYNKTNCVH